ncbi:MAG: methyltransferase domain-containing protein [Candidatus Pacearchaeota archaeon]|nr:methyltransferase domain-containing protein [Candidatus Pacearchaeota archaeon]
MIALFGSKGFVGTAILNALKKRNYEVTEITRENFEKKMKGNFDYVINAAMPSARFKAENNPEWDFHETVEKTAQIFYGTKFKKFVQISTLSARCQTDTVYGRHKLAAESVVNDGKSLIVRLGPLFGESLKKGVLIDMLCGSKVYIGKNSKYAFTPVDFVGNWIADNLDKKGIVEVGARNSISLCDLANKLGIRVIFEGQDSSQEILSPGPNYPDVELVTDFMKKRMENKMDERIKKCRICGNSLIVPCIDLGAQYLSSIFPENMSYKNELKKYSLEIVQCVKTNDSQCGSLQLAYDYDISEMYAHYPYTSSSNSSMRKILLDVANSGKALNILKDGDLILDIGCNDGTLLSFFENQSLDLIGIDPAQNVDSLVNSPRFVRVTDFFTKKSYESVTKKKAKLIFAIAMFYHLNNPIKFCEEIESVLDENGVAIIQMAYLPVMIKTNMYDNIVHEHVAYYSTQNIKWILEKAGLEVFDVILNDVYGGSFRIFAKKKSNSNFPVTERLKSVLQEEIDWGVFKEETYGDFMSRINKTRDDLKELLKKIKSEGKRTWIYGASTKGNTIMQFCDIGPSLVEAAADSNPFKFNKYLIGSDIPIYDEVKLRKECPEYLLVLPYSFIDAFKEREKELVAKGTKFILPLPRVKVVS